MMRSLIKYFFQGLLVVAPIFITVYVLLEIFLALDGIIPFQYPGLGILAILAAITTIGFIANYLISDRLKVWFNRQIRKAPLINLIYTAVKDVLNALVGDKRSFNKPVLVQLSADAAVKRIGFITDEEFPVLAGLGDEYITVYCPHSYNISGNVYLVPKKQITELNLPSADVMKYIVSAGVTQINKD
jgi:uncharacterized membrane protein